MISIDNISKSYTDAGETRVILNELSLSFEQGDSLSIQGASGSGKSTLLHLLAALDKPDSGKIMLQHEDCMLNLSTFSEKQADQYRKHHVGLIFQRFNLIDCISVWDNVKLPIQISKGTYGEESDAFLKELLSSLGVYQHRHKLPNRLSGGEQQRVAIARGLAHKPPLLLADEPTGNLDGKNSDSVSHLLVETCKAQNTALLMVTHSQKVARLTEQQWYLEDARLRAI
ncbi:ABC transporter ATP-binding protein [Glaciecola sp. MH2013]|uniref:ABC transporter ATP-binding protein n=1 Tax=Glaciecola sp. MH2013 TaxID=2785524 RepID=UPI0018A0E311|nr:ABC transporter ATP-binding protein [Glaciecola sp. MH2013]MBF7074820.1 ABC transporter ATP-binding protein [Glaciecola sp. MH2013]